MKRQSKLRFTDEEQNSDNHSSGSAQAGPLTV